eukprot:2014279-Prymnesium_polylepis.1
MHQAASRRAVENAASQRAVENGQVPSQKEWVTQNQRTESNRWSRESASAIAFQLTEELTIQPSRLARESVAFSHRSRRRPPPPHTSKWSSHRTPQGRQQGCRHEVRAARHVRASLASREMAVVSSVSFEQRCGNGSAEDHHALRRNKIKPL